MEHLRTIYERLLQEAFPTARGKDVSGADLVLVVSDTMGIASKFFANKGHLKEDDLRMLGECCGELKQIVPILDKSERQYFASMKQLAQEMLEFASKSKLSESEIELRYKWKKVYDQIKIIVNELDPIGVADVVDDEYDGLNFKVYSQLLESKDETKMFETIKSFVSKDYETVLPDADMMNAAKQLIKIDT